MPLYNRGSLDPNASMSSPAYREAAFQRQRGEAEPARRQARQELADEFGARGLGSGGQALQARLGQGNAFNQRLAEQRAGLGYQQAGMQETQRQVLEDRANQVEDRRLGYGAEDELARMAAEDRANEHRQKLWGQLLSGVGQVAGTYAGNKWDKYRQGQKINQAMDAAAPDPDSFWKDDYGPALPKIGD